MKKTLAVILCGALCGASLLGAAACGKTDDAYSVYAPDGAPALALCNAISQNGESFDYRVVDPSLINTYVTGEAPAADFCVLPVNAAAKLLGSGEVYQLLGTVTNGNLYFLTAGENEALTSENLSLLEGKTVGVVQLNNVPGLTLQVVLNKHGLEYQIVDGLEAEKAENKVNLLAVDATNVTPAYGCDYYLCPEPAATTKIKGTATAAKPFKAAGDLQKLYGGEEGYPQAALVAKKSVPADVIARMIGYMEGSAEYLKTASAETVLTLLEEKRTQGLAPAFNANNLNATVIANCSVAFTAAKSCKEKVNAYLAEIIAVNAASAGTASDAFFYEG